MELNEAIGALKEHEADLKQMGVKSLYVFGSTVRGEQHSNSDVDLFFDHEIGKLSVFDVMDIKDLASWILGRPADVMTRGSINRFIRRQVEAEAVAVFEDT